MNNIIEDGIIFWHDILCLFKHIISIMYYTMFLILLLALIQPILSEKYLHKSFNITDNPCDMYTNNTHFNKLANTTGYKSILLSIKSIKNGCLKHTKYVDGKMFRFDHRKYAINHEIFGNVMLITPEFDKQLINLRRFDHHLYFAEIEKILGKYIRSAEKIVDECLCEKFSDIKYYYEVHEMPMDEFMANLIATFIILCVGLFLTTIGIYLPYMGVKFIMKCISQKQKKE